MRFLWETGTPQHVPSVGTPGYSDIGDPSSTGMTLQALSRAMVVPESMALFQVADADRKDRSLAATEREMLRGYTATRPLEMQVWG